VERDSSSFSIPPAASYGHFIYATGGNSGGTKSFVQNTSVNADRRLDSWKPLPAIPTFTPLAFTDPSIPLSKRIVCYYVMWQPENPIREGTVHAIHLFAPAYTDEPFTSDVAADLRRALEIILHEDSRRVWHSSDLEIKENTYVSP
jgi:hypothetical protein